MRLIKIPNIEYQTFEKVRDAIFDTIPFACIESVYSKKLRTGFFNFWDVTYIPDSLKQYIVQPPMSRENVEKLHQALENAFANEPDVPED